MKKHTLGFIFDPTFSKVLLIEKQRPEWQRGRLNGIGGKIEEGEESLACMVREVREETGLQTSQNSWVYIGKMESEQWAVDVYAALHNGDLGEVATTTDEKIGWYEVRETSDKHLNNLHWLIPFAIDKLKHNEMESFSVNYKSA